MKNVKQYKPSSLELKDFDQKAGLVTFYFAAFGNRDSDGDVIEQGAYKKTILENKARIKHFKNHNSNEVPGVIQRIEEDTKGAFVTSQIAKTRLGIDTLIEYEAGIITEHSQGFNTIIEEFDAMDGVNRIKEVRLWEVSSLTHWGSNENTPVVDIKSLKDPIKLFESLNYILHKSNISDERGAKLNELYEELGKSIKSLDWPSKDTETLKPIIETDLLNSFKSKLKL
jgi:HK97 family phage prohead protease